MLVGRTEQVARLEDVVAEVGAGGTAALVVGGDAGIGKTALLALLQDRADDAGIDVLVTRGVEGEGRLAFVGLHDLLGPLTGDLSVLPEAQADALASALALAPPQFGDRLAVCAATLGLLRHAARGRPVLVVVDDVPWLDAPSQESVLFVAHRLGPGLGVVVGTRTSDLPVGVAALPGMTVPPLADAAARELLAATAPDLDPAVATAVVAAADGNPLALLELPNLLEADERAGLVDPSVPMQPVPQLGEAYGRRLARLPATTGLALLVVAAHDGDDLRTVAEACAALEVDAAALGIAETADLLTIADGRVEFIHPLVRGTVYHDAPSDRRRQVHAALADVLDGDRRAWHLGTATLLPDEGVAAELEVAGTNALVRRGPASAASMLERAARLSQTAEHCSRRLLAAGQAAAAAGLGDRAAELSREAAATATDPVLRASAAHLEGMVLSRTALRPAVAVLETEGRRVLPHDPVRAALMLSDAAMITGAGTDLRRGLALAQEAADLLTDDTPDEARALVLAILGLYLHWLGDGARARPIVDEAVELADGIDALGPVGQSLGLVLNVRLWSADFEAVRDRALADLERARDLGALSAMPLLFLLVADTSWRLGDWSAADEAIAECLSIGDASGQPVYVGHLRAIQAYLAAVRGDEGQVHENVDAILADVETTGVNGNVAFAHAALALLAISFERVDEATEHLVRLDAFTAQSGLEEPTLILWEQDLVEVHVRSGRLDQARTVLSRLGRRTAASGSPVARACHARACGLVEDDYDEHFTRALAADDERPLPFERARTQLAWGRRLHRDRRRAEARPVLHQAVATFGRLGATPWHDQAVAELRAAGGRLSAAARRAPATPDELTPQEERVAQTVARGLTNAQAAAELFLSPKTIEFHLSHIYRKLGIRSRTQLAVVLMDRDRAGRGSTHPG